MKTNYLISLILAISVSGLCNAEDLLTNHETYFKKTKAQSSSLPPSSKCLVEKNTLTSAATITNSGEHLKVKLQNNLSNCAFTEGYFYEPHISRENKLITITANSVFKKRRLSSSQLPANEKCDIFPGVYPTKVNVPSSSEGHYFIDLHQQLNGCEFSKGYIWEGHSYKGSLAVQMTSDSFFKKSPKDSSELPAADLCEISKGLYPLAAGASSAGEIHYKITLAKPLDNCNFSTGYVFYDHTAWKKPYVKPAEPKWSFPLPNGYYTSGWCICRNIGTSPHIGQDISKGGTKKAVAVQKGRLTSTSYSSTCGYISYLQDDYGTSWRYVHLNKPSVSSGSKVARGQHLAYISQYPRSGCGSGAHLHFERRSAGYFKDSSTGKSCQNGYRSCYYDPIKPWRSNYSAQQVVHNAQENQTNWSTLSAASDQSCKTSQRHLPIIAREKFAQYPTFESSDVVSKFTISKVNASHFDVNIYLKDNRENNCKNQRCLVQWQLVSESDDGNLRSVFFHNRVRNIPLIREAKEKHCLAEGAIRHWVLLKDNQGKQWKVEL